MGHEACHIGVPAAGVLFRVIKNDLRIDQRYGLDKLRALYNPSYIYIRDFRGMRQTNF